ncbi:translation initiation factor IF-2-like [Elephas maximus indicus]|uniref:translation initiation factor IF-2-like n=1 Tax=Elephas maximus indicus TaxID=99487 RepID=UPI002116F4E5|nr:translation initiation factor IF-2-like [Elephas maximus indicus]
MTALLAAAAAPLRGGGRREEKAGPHRREEEEGTRSASPGESPGTGDESSALHRESQRRLWAAAGAGIPARLARHRAPRRRTLPGDGRAGPEAEPVSAAARPALAAPALARAPGVAAFSEAGGTGFRRGRGVRSHLRGESGRRGGSRGPAVLGGGPRAVGQCQAGLTHPVFFPEFFSLILIPNEIMAFSLPVCRECVHWAKEEDIAKILTTATTKRM